MKPLAFIFEQPSYRSVSISDSVLPDITVYCETTVVYLLLDTPNEIRGNFANIEDPDECKYPHRA